MTTTGLLAATCLGCGGGSVSVRAGSQACATAAARQLGQVAMRVYREAGRGVNVAAAVGVVRTSRELQQAVARGDTAAIRSVLPRVMRGYISRIQIVRGTQVLADAGSVEALAPVSGALHDGSGAEVGRYRLAVLPISAYANLVAHLTGGTVAISTAGRPVVTAPAGGGRVARSAADQAFRFSGVAYPSGQLRIDLRIPASSLPSSCRDEGAAAAYAAGQIARTIYGEEVSSPQVRRAVRVVQRFTPLVRAVTAGDRAATHVALLKLLYNRMHIVRIRVLDHGGGVLGDVGGPLVLGPVRAPLRDAGGHRIGTVVVAIQDDRGLQLLTRRFTGALTLMRIGRRQLLGQLNPGPATLPDSGRVVYRDKRYEVYSFLARAFPTGRLRVSVLLPVR